MSPELETRVRHYAEHLDDLALPVTFDELIDREVDPVTMPEVERRVLATRRRSWVAAAAAILVIALIGGAALLLGNLGTEPDLIDEPTTTTAVDTTDPTTTAVPAGDPNGISINSLVAGTDIFAPEIGLDESGNPVIVYRHGPGGMEVESGQLEIVQCADPACAAFASSNSIEYSGADVNVFTAFALDGSPIIVIAGLEQVPKLHRCADPGCSSHTTQLLDSGMGIGSLTVDPSGNPAMLVTVGKEAPVDQLVTCLDPACAERTTTTLDLLGPRGWTRMTHGQDGFPLIVQITHDPEQLVNPTRVLHCGDATCASGNTITHVIDAPENTGNLAVSIGSDGHPVIALGNRQIQFLKCADLACTSVETMNDVGPRAIIDSISVGTSGTNPVLSFGAAPADGQHFEPMLAMCDDPACATGTIGGIDDLPSVWLAGSTTPDDRLAVAYGNRAELWVASCQGAGCAGGLTNPTSWDQTPVAKPAIPALGPIMDGWTRVPHDPAVFGPGGGGGFSSVIEAGPGLLALGETCELVDGNSVCDSGIWVSTDATSWVRVATGADLGGQPMAVAEGPDGLVAVGGICPERPDGGMGPCGAAIWTSPDGYTWEPVSVSPAVFGCPGEPGCDFRLEGIVAGGPGLVAWGGSFEGYKIWTSEDGSTWEPAQPDQLPPGMLIDGIVGLGTRLVAVGSRWTDIFDESGEWVSYEEDISILTSDDGRIWSRVPDARRDFAGAWASRVAVWERGVTFTGGFCDETYTCFGAVWNSPNGLTWNRAQLDLGIEQGGMFTMVAGGRGLIAAGHISDELQDSSTAVFWTSADGTTWDLHESDPAVFAEGDGINALRWLGESLVGVGASQVDRAPAVWVWTP